MFMLVLCIIYEVYCFNVSTGLVKVYVEVIMIIFVLIITDYCYFCVSDYCYSLYCINILYLNPRNWKKNPNKRKRKQRHMRKLLRKQFYQSV